VRVDLADRRYADARVFCLGLAEVAPEEVRARLTVADTFRLAGDFPRAIEVMQRLYAERPRDREVVQRLASLLERVGDARQAQELAKRLRELPADGGTAAR
jgi:Flp pilus assembly protein TadD